MINNKFAICLLDTGASISLLSKDFCQDFSAAKTRQDSSITLLSVTGQPISVYGEYDASIELGPIKGRHRFVAIDTDSFKSYQGILGNDFLTRFKVTYSAHTRTLRITGYNKIK